MFNNFPKGYYCLFMQIQARDLGLLAPYQLLLLLCQATSSESAPTVGENLTLSSKSNSNGLHFNSPIIAKLNKKFKSNCFFYYSENSGSITINVLLTILYKMPVCSELFFFTLLSCLWISISKALWHGTKPKTCNKRTLHQAKALAQLKTMAYLGGAWVA